jgi:hypothetical protein
MTIDVCAASSISVAASLEVGCAEKPRMPKRATTSNG